MSFIARRKVGDRVYLEERESYREGGKVKTRFVRYVGTEGEQRGKAKPRRLAIDGVTHSGSTRAGAVRLLWSVAQDLQIPTTIDRISSPKSSTEGPSMGELLTVWAINRVLDPQSATQLEPWTATTDLPVLTNHPAEGFNKDAFLRALDGICHDDPERALIVDHAPEIDAALGRTWREAHPLPKEERPAYAYDLTDVLFFGTTCPIAVRGRNPKHAHRPQVNVGVVVSRHDRMPVNHFVYAGNRNGAGTTRNLLAQLQATQVPPGLLIVDRGVASSAFVDQVAGVGWHLLGGLSKSSKDVQALLDQTEVPELPDTFVAHTRTGGLYAVKREATLWKVPRQVVVYANADKAVSDRRERNEALSRIGIALDVLAKKGKDWSEAKLHIAIAAVVGEWGDYLQVRVTRGGTTPRVAWHLHSRELQAAARRDGKYALLCTDPQLTAKDIVEAYLGKDFVEKAFRALKTGVEVEPVRHRRERRVRAYLFVCLLAYRLEMALRWRLIEGGVTTNTAEYQTRLLDELARVERTTVELAGQRRTWYLNVTDTIKDGLRRLKLPKLLQEGPAVERPSSG